MPITSKQRKALKVKAHHLKPVSIVCALLHDVVEDTDITLNIHELIKVQIQQGERKERQAAIDTLCQKTKSELIHAIGKVFIIYRQSKDQQ